MPRKRVGEVLLEQGAISPEQLQQALTAQKVTRQRLGATLIARGVISEVQLVQALSVGLSIDTVELASQPPDWAAIHLLRARFCEANELVPVAIETVGGRRTLLVATADPLSPALQEIEFTTGLPVSPRLAPPGQVREAIVRCYHRSRPGVARGATAAAPDDEPAIVVGQELPPPLPPKSAKSTVERDLDLLFGGAAEDGVDQLEKKFWALMNVLARKGLVTREEFTRELHQREER